MRLSHIQLSFIVSVGLLLYSIAAVSAQDAPTRLAVADDATPSTPVTQGMLQGLEASNLPSAGTTPEAAQLRIQAVVGNVIQAFIATFGIVFLCLLVYGGYKWLMAAGREDQVTKSKNIIQSSVIGLIIVLIAYLIAFYLVDVVLVAVSG